MIVCKNGDLNSTSKHKWRKIQRWWHASVFPALGRWRQEDA